MVAVADEMRWFIDARGAPPLQPDDVKRGVTPRHRQDRAAEIALERVRVVWLNPVPRANAPAGGRIPKWPKGTDCKSVGSRLRWFESSSYHHFNPAARP
jgi:hypothetical protein